jgi:hypothetical protein
MAAQATAGFHSPNWGDQDQIPPAADYLKKWHAWIVLGVHDLKDNGVLSSAPLQHHRPYSYNGCNAVMPVIPC